MSWIGRFWEGGGTHTGHLVMCIEIWKPRYEMRDGLRYVSTGRVRCDCGEEWDVGGWPL